MILNDILLSPWMHNSQARALLKSRAAVILDEQGFAYGLPMEEESKSKFREPLLGLFGDLLTEFADDDLYVFYAGRVLPHSNFVTLCIVQIKLTAAFFWDSHSIITLA